MRPKSQPIILAARISPPVLSIQSSRNIRQNSPIKHMWQCKHIPAHNRINKLHKQALLLTWPMAIAETKTPLNAGILVGKARSPTQIPFNCSRKDESQTTIVKKYGHPQKTPQELACYLAIIVVPPTFDPSTHESGARLKLQSSN